MKDRYPSHSMVTDVTDPGGREGDRDGYDEKSGGYLRGSVIDLL